MSSGDRLADAEDWARLAFSRGDLTQPELEDVLALVEIARGMERIEKTCDVVVQRIAEVGEPPAALSGTQIDAERMRDFARAALARLDSGAENTVGEPEPSFLVYDRVSNNILGEYESLDEAERYAAQINALNPSCAPVEVLRVSDDS